MIASALLLPLLLEGVAAFAPVPHAPSSIHRSAATKLSQMFSEESAALEVVDDEGGNAADPFDIYRASDAQKEIAIKDIKTGSGYTVGETDNQLLQIQFTAKFVEGQTKFSPTIKEFDVPSMVFKTGEERCLPGLEEGIQGMKVGGTRCVKVPPNKGCEFIQTIPVFYMFYSDILTVFARYALANIFDLFVHLFYDIKMLQMVINGIGE